MTKTLKNTLQLSNHQINNMKNNTITYIILIVFCFAFAFAKTGLTKIASFLGWIFIFITSGLFYYSGKNFVDQGVFNSNGWKTIFVILAPLIFYIDNLLNMKINWYNEFGGFAYYAIFTIGFLIKKIPNKIANFTDSIFKYKIIEKYEEDPKWATYLYLKNGEEHWNYTIVGSFMAKDSENDLTFVHYSREDAEKYASVMFKNAEQIVD